MTTCRTKSRQDWNCNDDRELVSLGCQQRIADALEIIAKSKADLEKSRDYWKTECLILEGLLATEKRRTAALRGIIRKLKAE